MQSKTFWGLVVLATGAMYSLPAASQVKPETLVKQRQAAMTLQGKYFYGELRPMAQGKMPYDAARVARDVAFLETLNKMPWDGFAASTKGVKSAATAAVFSEPAKFKEAQERSQNEIAKLASLVKSGDESAIKAQILAVDKTCASCHEDFRERQ
ncbi:MAG: c-type cytochrome [Rhodospirillaceae bacterium]